MIAAFSAMLVIPLGQDFFALVSLSPRLWLLTALIAAPSAAIALVCVRRNGP
jgi:hypothetical protein